MVNRTLSEWYTRRWEIRYNWMDVKCFHMRMICRIIRFYGAQLRREGWDGQLMNEIGFRKSGSARVKERFYSNWEDYGRNTFIYSNLECLWYFDLLIKFWSRCITLQNWRTSVQSSCMAIMSVSRKDLDSKLIVKNL